MSASAAGEALRGDFSMTSAGALAVNASLPSLAVIDWASLRAAARSLSSRLRSAATSTVPARSSSTVTPSASSDGARR